MRVAELREQPGIERIKGAPNELLSRGPECAQILDNGRLTLAIAEQIAAAVPIVEAQPVMGEDLVQDLGAMVPSTTACALVITAGRGCGGVVILEPPVGPMALCQELPAQHTHTSPRARRVGSGAKSHPQSPQTSSSARLRVD